MTLTRAQMQWLADADSVLPDSMNLTVVCAQCKTIPQFSFIRQEIWAMCPCLTRVYHEAAGRIQERDLGHAHARTP